MPEKQLAHLESHKNRRLMTITSFMSFIDSALSILPHRHYKEDDNEVRKFCFEIREEQIYRLLRIESCTPQNHITYRAEIQDAAGECDQSYECILDDHRSTIVSYTGIADDSITNDPQEILAAYSLAGLMGRIYMRRIYMGRIYTEAILAAAAGSE